MLYNNNNYTIRSRDFLINKNKIITNNFISLLEKLIGKLKGNKSTKKNKINLKNSSVCDQLIGKTDALIVKIIEFRKNTYISFKQIYLFAYQDLINAINNKKIAKSTNFGNGNQKFYYQTIRKQLMYIIKSIRSLIIKSDHIKFIKGRFQKVLTSIFIFKIYSTFN
jgi:hypothetical protein